VKYTDLLKAQNRSGKVPSLQPDQLTPAQQELANQGMCLLCGKQPSGRTSFVCNACEAHHSLDSIQKDIKSLREKILIKKG